MIKTVFEIIFSGYVSLGFLVATLGPPAKTLRSEFRSFRQGTPPHYERLGLTCVPPAPLWKCVTYFVLATIAAIVFWPGFIPEILDALFPLERFTKELRAHDSARHRPSTIPSRDDPGP